jgi:hypothetical protein|nr:MAG TPA: hypothetical protein [Caudoviricetes sp.]
MIGADILKTLLKEGEEPFSKALRGRLTTMSRNPNTIGALDDIADKMNIYKTALENVRPSSEVVVSKGGKFAGGRDASYDLQEQLKSYMDDLSRMRDQPNNAIDFFMSKNKLNDHPLNRYSLNRIFDKNLGTNFGDLAHLAYQNKMSALNKMEMLGAYDSRLGTSREIPTELIDDMLKMDTVNKSPYSASFYNDWDISWGHKPQGSLRVSDHWNFPSQGKTHARIKDNPDFKQGWALGQYDNGLYNILKYY